MTVIFHSDYDSKHRTSLSQYSDFDDATVIDPSCFSFTTKNKMIPKNKKIKWGKSLRVPSILSFSNLTSQNPHLYTYAHKVRTIVQPSHYANCFSTRRIRAFFFAESTPRWCYRFHCDQSAVYSLVWEVLGIAFKSSFKWSTIIKVHSCTLICPVYAICIDLALLLTVCFEVSGRNQWISDV